MVTGRLLASHEYSLAFKFLGVSAAHTHQVVMITMVVIAGQLKAATAFGQLQLPQ